MLVLRQMFRIQWNAAILLRQANVPPSGQQKHSNTGKTQSNITLSNSTSVDWDSWSPSLQYIVGMDSNATTTQASGRHVLFGPEPVPATNEYWVGGCHFQSIARYRESGHWPSGGLADFCFILTSAAGTHAYCLCLRTPRWIDLRHCLSLTECPSWTSTWWSNWVDMGHKIVWL